MEGCGFITSSSTNLFPLFYSYVSVFIGEVSGSGDSSTCSAWLVEWHVPNLPTYGTMPWPQELGLRLVNIAWLSNLMAIIAIRRGFLFFTFGKTPQWLKELRGVCIFFCQKSLIPKRSAGGVFCIFSSELCKYPRNYSNSLTKFSLL